MMHEKANISSLKPFTSCIIGPFRSSGGHRITFCQVKGEWKANVLHGIHNVLVGIPVHFSPGFCLQDIHHEWLGSLTHVFFPQDLPNKQAFVYVGTLGLLGGGQGSSTPNIFHCKTCAFTCPNECSYESCSHHTGGICDICNEIQRRDAQARREREERERLVREARERLVREAIERRVREERERREREEKERQERVEQERREREERERVEQERREREERERREREERERREREERERQERREREERERREREERERQERRESEVREMQERVEREREERERVDREIREKEERERVQIREKEQERKEKEQTRHEEWHQQEDILVITDNTPISLENVNFAYHVVKNKPKDKQETNTDTSMKSECSQDKAYTYSQMCPHCKDVHSILQLEKHTNHKLDDDIKTKLLNSEPFVQSSVYHYLIQGGKLRESIMKLPAEEWVEQSLICDLINSSQEEPVKLEALDQIRHVFSSIATERILFDLKKYHPLSPLDINDFLTCILACGNYTPESSKEADLLFKSKYKWIQLKLENSSSSSLKDDLVELLARSQLHLQVIEFLIDMIENNTEDLEELLKFIKENNLTEDEVGLIAIMKQISKDSNGNRLKSFLYEIQSTFLIKSSQIKKGNLFLLRTHFVRLLKQGYSFSIMQKLVNHKIICNKNINYFDKIVQLITDYQVDERTFNKIITNIKQSPPYFWLQNVNRLLIKVTFGNKKEYKLCELINKITSRPSNTSRCCNFTNKTLEAYYYEIESALHEPSRVLGLLTTGSGKINAEPIKAWTETQLKHWATCIQEKCFDRRKITHRKLLQEIVAGIIQGIKLYYKISPRDTQILTVCLLLNPKKYRGCLAQVPTGEGKSLIIAMLAIVHALLGRKVDIITTSTELSIPEAKKQAPFFELFNLTVGENSDIRCKQEVYKKHIVYGTVGDFQADILRSEFQGQIIRNNRGFGVILVDEVDSMLFDQRTQSTRLSEKLPAMDHLELVLANIWCLLNLTWKHLIRKDDQYLFILEDFTIDKEGNIVTASNSPVEECVAVIDDPLDFLKQSVEEQIKKNLRSLTPDEEKKKQEYEDLSAKSADLCKSFLDIQNELNEKIKDSSNRNKLKVEELSNEIEQLTKCTQQMDESNEAHKDSHKKLDKLKMELQYVEEELAKEVDSKLYEKRKTNIEEQLKLREDLRKVPWRAEFPIIEVPNHLLEFARQQIPHWVRSAIDALCYFERNKHYAIEEGKIVPISYNDTGVFQPNMVWGNGLTQFLQMKEGLMIQPESVATNYLSTHGFFKRYDHHLYGVTGTLGKYSTQKFFEKVYGTDQIKIPPHSYRYIRCNDSYYKCKEFPAKVFSQKESWMNTICKSCLVQVKVKRCVLVICQYVSQVQFLAEQLIKVYNYSEDKIFIYTGRDGEKFSRRNISPGEIVIATNIAGRGTDLSINQKAEINGGLHVCITFLPSHFRVELQNVGRTARKGERGSAQLLLYDPSGATIQKLKAKRDQKETESLKKAQDEIDNIKLQDQLFVKFCYFLGTIIPQMSQLHKVKEVMILENAYEREKEIVSDENLEEAFNKHTEELQDERLALLKKDPQYAQYSSSDVVSAIEKEIDMYRSTEYFNWKANYEKNLRESFCDKWKERISSDVLESFRLNIPLKGEKSDNSSLDYYDRLGVTEQWAIWLHMTFSAKKMKNEKEITESFKDFTEGINKQIEKGSQIQNPFYYNCKGNYKLNEGNLDSAIQCYEKAIEMDSRRSLYARINLARAYLLKKSPKKEMQVKAQKQYKEALNLIDNFYKPSLLQLYSTLNFSKGGEKTTEHISHQMDILKAIENHADKGIRVINEAQKKDLEVVVTTVESLEHIFKGGDIPQDYSHAVDEAAVNGMTHLATVEAREPTRWWSIVGVMLLGICQIAVGVLVTVYTAGILGPALIAEGVSDIIVGVRGAITGSFRWATWALEKAVSASLSLIFTGFNAIKSTYKAIKYVSTSTVCFKTGIKLATKQIGVALAKGVAKEVIDYTCDKVTENLFMEKIAKVIEETVGNKLTEAFEKNELIQKAISIDIKNQNNYYQDRFIREGIILLTEKKGSSNFIVTYLSRVWNGVLRRTTVNAPENEISSILQVLAKCTNSTEMRQAAIHFTEKFLDLYITQVERYRSDIEQEESKMKERTKETQVEMADHQETMLSEVDDNLEVPVHEIVPGEAYSPFESKCKHPCVPSNLNSLKNQFLKPITSNVIDTVKEDIVCPLKEMGTHSVIGYFSEQTEIAIEQQRKTYERILRSSKPFTT